MILKSVLCTLLFFATRSLPIECRSYNTGLIFYDLEYHKTFLPPTISVSRGRGLAKYQYSPRGSIWSTFGKPCECIGPLCGCCVGIKVKQYNFDQKICANVSYARPRDEVLLEVLLNDTSSAKYGISARNPSPLCVPIMMGIPMSMCIQMTNIGIQGDNLNMCMDFLVRLASTEIFEMHFQCMKVGLQGASWVGPDGQPVIPASGSKLKDKLSTDSDEYYDESEAENEITSQEEDKEIIGIKESTTDVNKAEEEMDNSDITEQIKNIVKEEEEEGAAKDCSETSEENKVDGIFSHIQDNENVKEIVTHIMDSINQANAVKEIDENKEETSGMEVNETHTENTNVREEENKNEKPVEMEAVDSFQEPGATDFSMELNNKTQTEEGSKEEMFKGNEELQENGTKTDHVNSMKQEASGEDKQETINSDKEKPVDVLENTLKDEHNIEELFKDSQKNEMQMESDHLQMQDTTEAATDKQEMLQETMTPIVVLEESTTVKSTDDEETTLAEHSEMLQSTTDNEPNKLLEIIKPLMKTSTESMTKENEASAVKQNILGDIGTSNSNTVDNSLTTAAITTTTSSPITTTNKPTRKPTISAANFAAALTFTKSTDEVEDDGNDDEEEDDENCSDDSHEDDSDYEDEESDEIETENETKEKTSVQPNAMPANNNKGNELKESLAMQEVVANDSSSDESQSAEDDNDSTHVEFETEEGEEEYDEEEFEDYETTSAAEATTSSKEFKTHNNTCCKPVAAILPTTKPEIPQPQTASSHNLQSVSTSNNMISQTDDKNMLNTKSTNEMSSASNDSIATATTAAVALTKQVASGNGMPLPLARNLHFTALHHLHHLHHHHHHKPQQLKRQNRQLQQYV